MLYAWTLVRFYELGRLNDQSFSVAPQVDCYLINNFIENHQVLMCLEFPITCTTKPTNNPQLP